MSNKDEKYKYKGALEGVKVKAVIFLDMPDYIFSVDQWNNEGGWRGLIKGGAFSLRDVDRVETGIMNPIDFDALDAWEG